MSEYVGEPIRIYGKPGCVYCERAKRFLDKRIIPYRYIDVTQRDLTQDHKNVVNSVLETGYRSLPMVFIDNEFIGGYTELEAKGFE